jgi:PAS domain S-box-containing protein
MLLFLATAIHERKLSDEKARVEHKRFQLMMEAMKDTVYERDIPGGAMSWSARALTRFGYARGESFGRFRDFSTLVHEEDRAQLVDRQEEALREGRELWDAEFRMRRADGTYAHVHETGFIVRAPSGMATQMIGALDDVTDRHDADELNHRLAQASRLTAMGELAASIAHEINQPVAAVLGNVDAARMLLDSRRPDRDELRAILDDIRRDNLRTGDIVRHIRGLANKRGTQATSFDLNEMLESALDLVMPAAKRRGMAIYGAYGHVPRVTADPIHVQQVVLNLIFNAMDAMRDVPAKDRVMLVMSSREEDRMVHVAVRDRGHGIPPGLGERIFESFYTTKSDGMGLGLSIARSLVTAHGGSIWAKSNSDQGATFTFTIPASRAP